MPVTIPEVTIRATVTAHEVIPPGSAIELELSEPVDPQSAQAAVSVRQGCTLVPVTITLAKRRETGERARVLALRRTVGSGRSAAWLAH